MTLALHHSALPLGLSQREKEVCIWVAMGLPAACLLWGWEGFFAIASVASWLLPGWRTPLYRHSTGRILDDISAQLNHGLLTYPLFLWYALHWDARAFAILPLAAALATCYIISWYGPGGTEENRRRCCGFIWATGLALIIGA